MPQRTIRTPTLYNQEIDDSNFLLVPGLSVALLTGSGWIDCDFFATVKGASDAAGLAYLRYKIDGEDRAANEIGGATLTVPQDGYVQIATRLPIRLGAGQHTIELHAYASIPGIVFSATTGALVITELGF